MKVLIGLFIIFIVFTNPCDVRAEVLATINNINPSEISNKEQQIQVDTTLTGLPASDSYIRVSLDGGVSYVGYMKDNLDVWVKIDTLDNDKKDGQCVKYLKVNLDGNYTLKFKIGSENNVTNETKVLKVHRFTDTCKTASDIGDATITINLPTPTPSPTQAPTAQPTSAPTTTSTATTTPKPTPTKTSTPKATTTPTPTEEAIENNNDSNENQITIELETNSPTPTGLVAGAKTENKSKAVAIIFISAGIGFLGYCGYLIYNGKNATTKNTP